MAPHENLLSHSGDFSEVSIGLGSLVSQERPMCHPQGGTLARPHLYFHGELKLPQE